MYQIYVHTYACVYTYIRVYICMYVYREACTQKNALLRVCLYGLCRYMFNGTLCAECRTMLTTLI